MILGSALASVCWWSCYNSSQLIVSIKSALTNWTIGSISHHCVSIHSFMIQNAKKLLSTLAASHIIELSVCVSVCLCVCGSVCVNEIPTLIFYTCITYLCTNNLRIH
jgi:hypothetical protein